MKHKEYHHTIANRKEIEQSEQCFCTYCHQHFAAREVTDFIKDKSDDTALCPNCGTDAVIGDACGLPDKTMLKRLH